MKFSNIVNTIGHSYNFQWIYLNCMTTIAVHFMLNHSGFFFDIVHLQLEKKSFHFINFKNNHLKIWLIPFKFCYFAGNFKRPLIKIKVVICQKTLLL